MFQALFIYSCNDGFGFEKSKPREERGSLLAFTLKLPLIKPCCLKLVNMLTILSRVDETGQYKNRFQARGVFRIWHI